MFQTKICMYSMQSAIKQSTTALSKHKDDYLILSLKCYALTMAGKREEASLVSQKQHAHHIVY